MEQHARRLCVCMHACAHVCIHADVCMAGRADLLVRRGLRCCVRPIQNNIWNIRPPACPPARMHARTRARTRPPAYRPARAHTHMQPCKGRGMGRYFINRGMVMLIDSDWQGCGTILRGAIFGDSPRPSDTILFHWKKVWLKFGVAEQLKCCNYVNCCQILKCWSRHRSPVAPRLDGPV